MENASPEKAWAAGLPAKSQKVTGSALVTGLASWARSGRGVDKRKQTESARMARLAPLWELLLCLDLTEAALPTVRGMALLSIGDLLYPALGKTVQAWLPGHSREEVWL
jgi:hypothetical protein